MLDRTTDLGETAMDGVLDILRASVPCIILDVPHGWNAWIRRTLIASDEIVIVAAPDLASLRNAKNLFDSLRRRGRPTASQSDPESGGSAQAPEIAPAEFGKALGVEVSAIFPFDAALFGTASNNGQMIAEVQASGKDPGAVRGTRGARHGRIEPKRTRANLLQPIMAKLARRKAS
jgi:pilus assembly protein CpaE